MRSVWGVHGRVRLHLLRGLAWYPRLARGLTSSASDAAPSRTAVNVSDLRVDVRTLSQVGSAALALVGGALVTGVVYANFDNRADKEMAQLREAMVGLEKTVDAKVAGFKESVTKEVDAKVAGVKESVTKEVDAKVAGVKGEVDAKLAGARVAAEAEALRVLKDYGVRQAPLVQRRGQPQRA